MAHDTANNVGWTAFLGRLTWRSVSVALALGALAAALLYPAFHVTPFAVVLGRCLFLSMVLLLAFAAAGHWQQRWLPRWLMQALAVVLAAPVATAAVYLLSTGGSATAFLTNPGMLWGFAFIAGTGVVVGLVLALGAMVREQQALARGAAAAASNSSATGSSGRRSTRA